MKCYYFIIPPFHYSIIPGWKKKNGWLGIPCYQRFVEVPIHLNKDEKEQTRPGKRERKK
jgi:hypothetical protein